MRVINGMGAATCAAPLLLSLRCCRISCSTALLQFLLVHRADESHLMSEPGCFQFFSIIIIDSSLWLHNVNGFVFPTDCFTKLSYITQKTPRSPEQQP